MIDDTVTEFAKAWLVTKESVKVTSNSPSQDYTPPADDHNLLTYDMTPGFKPFTIKEETDICLGTVSLAKTTALVNTVFLHLGVFVGSATKTRKTKG